VLSAGTTVDDQGRVNISLANVDLVNTRTIAITINSSKTGYVVSSAQVITGPAKDSYPRRDRFIPRREVADAAASAPCAYGKAAISAAVNARL